MGTYKRIARSYNIDWCSIGYNFLGFNCMKKLLIPLLLMPFLVQAKDIAIAPNGMMGMTVLTDERCDHDKNLLAAYAYNPNKMIYYACWQVSGEDVVFNHTVKPLVNIPVKQFIKPPENVRHKNKI